MITKTLISIVVALALIVGGFFLWSSKAHAPIMIKDFNECVAAGYPVMESYPRQCRTPDKQVFVEVISPPYSDLIQIDSPKSGDTIASPLTISGEARGNWYFEASFPVKLIDATGVVLAQVPAQASGDWMTENFVPFTARLEFKNPQTKTGELILAKDNPSGLPENDEEFRVPVVFKNVSFSTTTSEVKVCKPTGCSGQICSDTDVASTCEYRADYACYRTALCKRQATGICGWAQTPELQACLASPPSL